MQIRRQGYRWQIPLGIFWLSIAALDLLVHANRYSFLSSLILGLAYLTAAAPYVTLLGDRIILKRLIFPKTIRFNDLVRIEARPSSKGGLVLHQADGRKTTLFPNDPAEVLRMLAAHLPDGVCQSTGTAPPPSAFERKKLRPFAWMGLVYDAKTNTIKSPSDR